MTIPASVWEAAEVFRLPGSISGIEAHGDGLIHDTYVVCVSAAGGPKRFILQRINQRVFANPVALMKNIECVVHHIQERATQSGRDPERAIAGMAQTADGAVLLQADGEAWRMFHYMEGTITAGCAVGTSQAYRIASTFGRFLDDLSDFPLHLLRDSLPGYRDTQLVLMKLWQTLDQDPWNRAKDVGAELAFIEARREQALRLQQLQRSGQLPLRAIHGDTKLNNVLLDIATGHGVCAIDLDTVMPGLLLHDVGDCVREALISDPQQRESLQTHDLGIVEALVSGFLSQLSARLSELEIVNIVPAIRSITLELGARFLADYLAGDLYFKTAHASENLQRARQHFRLAQRIERSESDLNSIVRRCECQR